MGGTTVVTYLPARTSGNDHANDVEAQDRDAIEAYSNFVTDPYRAL